MARRRRRTRGRAGADQVTPEAVAARINRTLGGYFPLYEDGAARERISISADGNRLILTRSIPVTEATRDRVENLRAFLKSRIR